MFSIPILKPDQIVIKQFFQEENLKFTTEKFGCKFLHLYLLKSFFNMYAFRRLWWPEFPSKIDFVSI